MVAGRDLRSMAVDADGPTRRILVVDDEPSIRELVETALGFVGYAVETADSGRTALAAATRSRPDLIVLDIMLPDFDGFEVCRRLRDGGDDVPVIYLTARDDPADLVRGLEGGGDDYVTKPFALKELVARVEAVLRRTAATASTPRGLISYADLTIDETAHRVTRDGVEIALSPTEFKLLRFLAVNAEKVVSKSQILDHVWQYDFGGDASVVETYVSYLRKKVDSFEPKLLKTVRGFGYVMRADD